MMLDFGVDPRCIDTMSLAEIRSTTKALAKRRGKAELPSREVRDAKMQEFLSAVSWDPRIKVH